jgi:hypothetical protein
MDKRKHFCQLQTEYTKMTDCSEFPHLPLSPIVDKYEKLYG